MALTGLKNWSGFASVSFSLTSTGEKMINLWIFFQPVFTGAGQGGKVCKKAPRVDWFLFLSLVLTFRRPDYLKRTRADPACFMHWVLSPLIGLYSPALIRHEYVIIYIFNLPLVNFNFYKVKHWQGHWQRNINNKADGGSQLDHWGQRGKSFSLHCAG